MKRTLRPALLVFALLLPASAWAGDAEDCASGEALLKTAPARVMAACRRLADQGDAYAQANLGVMYDNGQGVPQDDAEAVKWVRKAAGQGHAPAQSYLGAMYALGRGVPQDYVQAHMWLNLAAAQGDADAAEKRDMAAALMTPADISKAQQLAREWAAKHPQ